MQFHEFTTYFDSIAKSANLKLEHWPKLAESAQESDPNSAAMYAAEYCWISDKRPYYSVFPSFASPLTKTKLELDSKHIDLPISPLLIRFAVGHELDCGCGKFARSVLVHHTGMAPGQTKGLRLTADFGETAYQSDFNKLISNFEFLLIHLVPGKMVSDQIDELTDLKDGVESSPFKPLISLVCSLCLLQDNPDLIKPDVLTKDKVKFDTSPTQLIIDRAHRKGKKGWLIGSDGADESSPHFRRPHFGVRWTGEGRSIPAVVPIKGSVVNRKKIAEVPHGRLDD